MDGETHSSGPAARPVRQAAWALWFVVVVAGYYLLNEHYPRHFRWYAWRGWQAAGPTVRAALDHLRAIATAALVLVAGVGYGRLVLHRRAPADALACGLGLGVMGGLLFAAGQLAGVGPGVALAVCGPGIALFVARRRRGLPLAWPRGPRLLRAVGATFALVALIGALAPETGIDALAEHLPVVRHLATHGTRVEFPASGASYYPPLLHLLMATAWSLGGEAAARLLGLGFVLASLPLLHELARRAGLDELAGETAIALYLTHLLVGIYATKCYLDLPFTYFVLAAATCGMRQETDPDSRWAELALWFAGLAAASRPHGLFVLLIVGLLVAGAAVVRREPGRVLLAGLAVTALCALPWIWRNLQWTGNPLYPFGSVAMVQDSIEGAGRGLRQWVALPLGLTFSESQFVLPWGPLALALLPLGLFELRWGRALIAIVAAATAYLLVWFLTIQNVRYLIPLLALTLVGCAGGLAAAWRAGGLLRGCAVLAVGIHLALNLLVLLLGSQQYDHRGLLEKLPVIAGRQPRDDYWLAHVPWAPAVRHLDRVRRPGEPVLLGPGASPYLHLAGPQIRLDARLPDDPAALWLHLRARGVRYLLVQDRHADALPERRRWLLGGRVLFQTRGFSVRELPAR